MEESRMAAWFRFWLEEGGTGREWDGWTEALQVVGGQKDGWIEALLVVGSEWNGCMVPLLVGR